jgi:hypothetical protein
MVEKHLPKALGISENMRSRKSDIGQPPIGSPSFTKLEY